MRPMLGGHDGRQAFTAAWQLYHDYRERKQRPRGKLQCRVLQLGTASALVHSVARLTGAARDVDVGPSQ